MSEIIKTVTASFETIDLAELACRRIKEKFSNIKAISIRYKNIPYDRQNYHSITEEEVEIPLISGASALGGISAPLNNGIAPATPIGTVYAGVNINADGSLKDNHTPEIYQSLESKVIIKSTTENANKISNLLRGLGGQNIIVK